MLRVIPPLFHCSMALPTTGANSTNIAPSVNVTGSRASFGTEACGASGAARGCWASSSSSPPQAASATRLRAKQNAAEPRSPSEFPGRSLRSWPSRRQSCRSRRCCRGRRTRQSPRSRRSHAGPPNSHTFLRDWRNPHIRVCNGMRLQSRGKAASGAHCCALRRLTRVHLKVRGRRLIRPWLKQFWRCSRALMAARPSP